MKKALYTLILTIAAMSIGNSQEIHMEKVFGGYKYTQNGQLLRMGQMVKIMKPNEEAFKLVKKARTNNTVAGIFGGAGGALIGWPLGTALGGGDPEWGMAAIGAGLIVVGIPFATAANKNAKQAVALYNASLNSNTSSNFEPQFQLISSSNGIGISMTF
jgi:hypothetical protein